MAPSILQTHWQGPFPPPDAVERYEKVHDGAFNRILTLAEQLQNAQIAQSSTALGHHHADVRRAQWLATGSMIAAMAGALLSAVAGHDVIAGLFLAVPVMGVVKALVDSARGVHAAQSQRSGEAANTPSTDG